MISWVLLIVIGIAAITEALVVAAPAHKVLGDEFPPLGTLQLNLEAYHQYLESASILNTTMMVFPEFGLGGKYDSPKTMDPYCETIEVGNKACRNASLQSLSPALSDLSCESIQRKMWIIYNTCHRSAPGVLYNTEVVINPEGTVVARYFKSHVFHRFVFHEPSSPDVVLFECEGIQMGIIICFDIAFTHPSKDIVEKGAQFVPYSVALNVIGLAADVFETWTRRFPGTALMASNLGGDDIGLYHNGKSSPVANQHGNVTAFIYVP